MTDLPLTVPHDFRIIAHRGASGYAPENTLAAFRLAAQMGVREVELDIQYSMDRELVVIHDENLDRYGFPDCRVAEMTLAELQTLDMGRWFDDGRFAGERLATLDEILTAFGDTFVYHAEIKVPADGLARRVLDCLDNHGVLGEAIITSFDFDAAAEVVALTQRQRVGWLVREDEFIIENVERAAAAGFFQFCPRVYDMSERNVAEARRHVAEVRGHGVRNVDDLVQAVRAKCDGATINWPDWLMHEPG
ncbi:MAG: glycerophosphodiester phosphodiesterase family protein [Alphaproteobacteria bacterium]|nr:glycerophosphodiester phosphodiesterase family protein [Alphaproteobacteria bacterium]